MLDVLMYPTCNERELIYLGPGSYWFINDQKLSPPKSPSKAGMEAACAAPEAQRMVLSSVLRSLYIISPMGNSGAMFPKSQFKFAGMFQSAVGGKNCASSNFLGMAAGETCWLLLLPGVRPGGLLSSMSTLVAAVPAESRLEAGLSIVETVDVLRGGGAWLSMDFLNLPYMTCRTP